MSALCVLGVRSDDVAHQAVADDVPVPQVAEPDPFDPRQDALDLEQAGILAVGQVDLRLVPRDHRPGVHARRVRNIFICIPVAFWASSRITKASERVRPRMYASGAISMV